MEKGRARRESEGRVRRRRNLHRQSSIYFRRHRRPCRYSPRRRSHRHSHHHQHQHPRRHPPQRQHWSRPPQPFVSGSLPIASAPTINRRPHASRMASAYGRFREKHRVGVVVAPQLHPVSASGAVSAERERRGPRLRPRLPPERPSQYSRQPHPHRQRKEARYQDFHLPLQKPHRVCVVPYDCRRRIKKRRRLESTRARRARVKASVQMASANVSPPRVRVLVRLPTSRNGRVRASFTLIGLYSERGSGLKVSSSRHGERRRDKNVTVRRDGVT